MSKPFHAGKAAFNGVLAAQLAHTGFDAAHDLIEAHGGMGAALIQDKSKTVGSIAFAGGDWEVLRNTFKPYASCLLTHPVIDAARKLHGKIGNRSIESIVVNVHPMAVQLAGKTDPRTPLEGKFSTAYCTALALSGYKLAATDFSADRLQDPRLRDLVGRVKLNIAHTLAKTSASVVATLQDGTRIEESTPLALGNPGNPMSWADMESKFMGLAEPALPRTAKAVFTRLRRFSSERDIDSLFTTITRH
jgi:2-methylcitrate dehydratase PrpD